MYIQNRLDGWKFKGYGSLQLMSNLIEKYSESSALHMCNVSNIMMIIKRLYVLALLGMLFVSCGLTPEVHHES